MEQSLAPETPGDRCDSGAVIAGPLAPVSALVAGVVPAAIRSIVLTLAAHGCHVTLASSYVLARERLATSPPALLITEIRLAEHNGLQLVLRGKSLRPEMATVVLASLADAGLQADAESMGATFVLGPVPDEALATAVFRTIFERRDRGTPVRPPFERRSTERRAKSLATESERRRADRRREIETLLG
jgi:DNA-binding NtrC family response regulator